MHLWAWRILRAILLGTILSWLAAWSFARAIPTSLARWGSRDNETPWLAFRHESGIGIDRYVISTSHKVWPEKPNWSEMRRATLPDWIDLGEDFSTTSMVVCIGAGWPARSFTARFESNTSMNAPPYAKWVDAYVNNENAMPAADDRIIPLRILPLGFAINAATFSAGIFCIMLATATSRRLARRMLGRCPNCGYDLRRDFARGCPECGWNRENRTGYSLSPDSERS